MNGILNINKPPGKTSFDVVAIIRRLSGERRVGHAGTLDPEATGVLPVCLGQATRVVEFLQDATKAYRAEVELGVTTDTYDGSGRVVSRTDASSATREQVEAALTAFRGTISQVPPMYSALKLHGEPLYKLARRGETAELQSRQVVIYEMEIVRWEPPTVTLDVVCSKGTYIRSIAYDLGQALGYGAYMKGLVRTRNGIFGIHDAVSLPELELAFRHGYWHYFIYPTDAVLVYWQAMVLGEVAEDDVRKGRPPSTLASMTRAEPSGQQPAQGEERCRAYTVDGRFLGVLHFNTENGLWHPEKVFA